jgi:hypothetical protein
MEGEQALNDENRPEKQAPSDPRPTPPRATVEHQPWYAGPQKLLEDFERAPAWGKTAMIASSW